MTFSFVAHIRCNWMRCTDACDATVNPLHEGVIDTLASIGSTFGYLSATRGAWGVQINLRSGLNAAEIATRPAPRKPKAASFSQTCLLVAPSSCLLVALLIPLHDA